MRCNQVLTKVKGVLEKGKNLVQLVSNYPVKVADSCPLAIEQQRLQQQQRQHSQQEIEAIRLQKMKKQAFLEKISRELREKQKQNHLKKKQSAQAQSAQHNVEEYLKLDNVENDIMMPGKKKQP